LGLGSQPYVLLFSGSFIRSSHVCIVPMFLNILAFQASYYIYVIRGVASLLATSCWPGTMWGVVEPVEFVEA
jgi:hypothetical protein